MAEISKEQEEEFKKRFKRKDDTEFKELPEEQLKAFLKATDDKCDGDG